MPKILLIGSLTLLSACGGIGSATDCDAWRPIRVSREDILTRDTARDVLAHNLTGQRLGCW